MAIFATPGRSPQPAHQDLPISYLDQGWSKNTRDTFHYMTQGSELIPYDWFLNLMEPDGVTRLRDDLNRFGMLYDATPTGSTSVNKDHLPIGFALQAENRSYGGITEKKWLGLTCAACHTGAIVPKGASNPRFILVDGAPAKADMAAFFATLKASIDATYSHADRLDALAQKAHQAGDGSVAEIKKRFENYTRQFGKIMDLYLPQASGPGRLDCIGAIINRVCVYDIKSDQPRPSKLDAPVDFPFIWYTDRQSEIQWFGGLANANWLDRLSRNAGEVSGVFAQVDVKHGASFAGYASSVNVAGLNWIDQKVTHLTPPKWTDVFPAPDAAAVQRGRTVFVHTCQANGCHQDLAPAGKVATVLPTPLSPDLNTDPNNTTVIHTALARTGVLQGDPVFLIPFPGEPKYGPQAPAIQLVGTTVAGELLGKKLAVVVAYINYLINERGQSKLQAMAAAEEASKKENLARAYSKPPASRNIVGYESRSLNGIWATAPYLHNGSVPNLYELLWPNEREETFYVGSYVYDPEKMGFLSGSADGGILFDTRLSGNHNTGHTYGASLSDAEKWDLMAYLKTL